MTPVGYFLVYSPTFSTFRVLLFAGHSSQIASGFRILIGRLLLKNAWKEDSFLEVENVLLSRLEVVVKLVQTGYAGTGRTYRCLRELERWSHFQRKI